MNEDQRAYIGGIRDTLCCIITLAKAIRESNAKETANELALVIDHIARLANGTIDVDLMTDEEVTA